MNSTKCSVDICRPFSGRSLWKKEEIEIDEHMNDERMKAYFVLNIHRFYQTVKKKKDEKDD